MTTLSVDRTVGRLVGAARLRQRLAVTVGVPALAVLAALSVGAALMAVEGVAAMSVYGEVLRGVFVLDHGLTDTAVAATPLLLIGLGLAVAYRAKVFTIGAEGQYLVGAVAATAWATAAGVRDWPGAPLVVTSLLVAVLAGGAWAAVTAGLNSRFGASVVITSLLLNYVATALLAWAVRVGIRDPGSFTPQSREIGAAALPVLPGLDVHLGFLLAVATVPLLGAVLARTRFGFRVDVMGANAEVLGANEARPARVTLAVLLVCGAFAGAAGYIQVAGVSGRLTPGFATGYGFTAIVVALLGRLRPVGVLVAALTLSALTIGFDVAERSYEIRSSTVGVIQALVVVFFVAGDALARRST
ncbi:ABC transporter permease [Phytohabitans rumicis]|uniref:ABC transporter permease n=1 Tax=Phytohabitans rumicis TaxID=1076125 RepID=A0A6V8L3A2_9ACTN|nr:ABC transporter permease [Phytohabitans rumicis]GFJ87185.1 ABC transporter permease [Phytohabitans rumicis]